MKLSDIVAVSGLLLTLVTFLFNLAWPKINEALNLDESISGTKAINSSKKKALNTLLNTVLPIFIAFLALFYVNLPTAVKIISTSNFSIWNFDVDDTLYVMVVFALASFVIFNGSLIYKLYKKWRAFSK